MAIPVPSHLVPQARSPAILQQEERVLPLPAFAAALPDGGLPRGAVVELTSHGSGLASSLALHACASAQREALLRGGDPAWCAWLDPSRTLYAPGVASHGVVLERLLVVYPPAHSLARAAVRMTLSHVFSVLIVDTQGVPGGSVLLPLLRWPNVVRRLAMAAREGDTCVVLLTDRQRAAPIGLPVALRLELEQPQQGMLRSRVVKERRGRIGMPVELAWTRPQRDQLSRSA
jgi:hypothetical protein